MALVEPGQGGPVAPRHRRDEGRVFRVVAGVGCHAFATVACLWVWVLAW